MHSFVLHFLVEYIIIKISNTLFNQEGHFKGFKLNFCWSGCGGGLTYCLQLPGLACSPLSVG